MQLVLERFSYAPTETEGEIHLDDGTTLHTMERPWRAGEPGGLREVSCVPDGSYELHPHRRPNGDDVLALRNPNLHVYLTPDERDGRPGRDLILIHVGNFVGDVVGCIAPGTERGVLNNQRAVLHSHDAVDRIMDLAPDSLLIRSRCGTGD